MDIPLLTKGESRAYSTLVEIGESTIGNIVKVSGVSHSKIYDILKRLAEKGLVSAINRNGRQYFSSSRPSSLFRLIEEEKQGFEEKKNEMDRIVKELELRKGISTPTSLLSAFEGIKGMKAVLDSVIETLRNGDEVLILGAPRQIGEQAGGYLREWQRRRIKKRTICRIITDKDAPSWHDPWWVKSKKDKLTFTKRSKSVSPAYLVITKDTVITIYFSSVILSFTINQKGIASRYREFFNQLWK